MVSIGHIASEVVEEERKQHQKHDDLQRRKAQCFCILLPYHKTRVEYSKINFSRIFEDFSILKAYNNLSNIRLDSSSNIPRSID